MRKLISLIILFYLTCAATLSSTVFDVDNVPSAESLKLENVTDPRLPVHSKCTVGRVKNHHVNSLSFSQAIFILGEDAFSAQWLEKHAKELKALNAIGFVANAQSAGFIEIWQQRSGLPLLPANVDSIMEVLGENHYPIIVVEGKIWQ